MNTYKKSLLVLSLLIGTLAWSQPDRSRKETRDRIEALRVSFITEKLDLSPEEAQKFWPVYNQYRKELEQTFGKGKGEGHGRHNRKDIDQMSDEEIRQMLTDEFERQEQLLALRRQYLSNFEEVLPLNKVAKLYKAEGDFQRQLIRKLSEREKQKP